MTPIGGEDARIIPSQPMRDAGWAKAKGMVNMEQERHIVFLVPSLFFFLRCCVVESPVADEVEVDN